MISENDSIRLIFGLKIKALRQSKGLSYQQLADQAGMSVSYVHDIETGKKFPKADKIIVLARTLGVDYDYLVSLRASKKLQPVIDLISSDFINAIPWEHFGLSPANLLDLFSSAPDKVTAFISTLLKISRRYQLSKEGFYNSALRSYQDLHDNYFEDLETAVMKFRETNHITTEVPLSITVLENILTRSGIQVNRKKMGSVKALDRIRSYYAAQSKTLYINKRLSVAQEKFLIGRELGFQFLNLSPRPYETVYTGNESFEIMLNNFKASYFSAALLMPEEHFVEQLKVVARQQTWNANSWMGLVLLYDVTPEMMMERMTNILPRHFGIDHLFFLRMNGNGINHHYEMTKELHLSQLHNPYGNALHEHYCHRWISIKSIKAVVAQATAKKYTGPLVEVQISQYWQTHNRYLCISMAKPLTREGILSDSVTIGLLIDQNLVHSMPFVNDPAIVVRTVHTTCERCGILDCLERVASPVVLQKEDLKAEQEKAMKLLN
jgi:transcriptional regulator with XRE-family HTH domain/Zn-dependent peptidase ImmA (M78 family)